MTKFYGILFGIIFFFPLMAHAEFELSEHRWAIGYEGSITLRRFLGKNWEIFLGGGPNDRKIEDQYSSVSESPEGELVPHSENSGTTKIEEGFVYLGGGRTLVRDQRFWLASTFSVKYNWKNFQYTNDDENLFYESVDISEKKGHRMITTAAFGLRPSYDLTSRITLMIGISIFFRHLKETTDYWAFDETRPVRKTRSIEKSTSLGLSGYRGIESISFMFRF